MPGLSLTLQQSSLAARTWALVPGVREVVLVAFVVAALYGRSARPWPGGAARRLRDDRPARPDRRERALVRWVLDRRRPTFALIIGAVLAAWVATAVQVVLSWTR